MVSTSQVPDDVKSPKGSGGKLQGFIGIIAITLGQLAAILTHVDQLREFILKYFGGGWLYVLHAYLIYIATALLLVGYGSLTYWLYVNFIWRKSYTTKVLFFMAAVVAVSGTVVGSVFFFRPVDMTPLMQRQLGGYAGKLISQQVLTGEDDGGFKFSQNGNSTEAQVWTTAQCLTALLQQDPTALKQMAPNIRRAFDYIERARLKSANGGWGYMKDSPWGGH